MERQMDMENRRYIVDVQPYLFSFMDILREDMTEDTGSLDQCEIVSLTRLPINHTIPLGNCQVKRVI